MKNMKIWLMLFAVVLAVGIIGSALVLQKSESSIVEIVQDGEVIYRLDLSEYKEPETIEIAYDGGKNTVHRKRSNLYVSCGLPGSNLCKNGMAEIGVTPHCVPSASFGYTVCRKQ